MKTSRTVTRFVLLEAEFKRVVETMEGEGDRLGLSIVEGVLERMHREAERALQRVESGPPF